MYQVFCLIIKISIQNGHKTSCSLFLKYNIIGLILYIAIFDTLLLLIRLQHCHSGIGASNFSSFLHSVLGHSGLRVIRLGKVSGH